MASETCVLSYINNYNNNVKKVRTIEIPGVKFENGNIIEYTVTIPVGVFQSRKHALKFQTFMIQRQEELIKNHNPGLWRMKKLIEVEESRKIRHKKNIATKRTSSTRIARRKLTRCAQSLTRNPSKRSVGYVSISPRANSTERRSPRLTM